MNPIKDVVERWRVEKVKEATEPKPDLAHCIDCNWKGKVSDCEEGEEGDWETGYYKVDYCPECEDGGYIEYNMSWWQARKWNKWYKKYKG